MTSPIEPPKFSKRRIRKKLLCPKKEGKRPRWLLPRLEQLVQRRLLSGASLPAGQGAPRQPVAVIANDPGGSLTSVSKATSNQQASCLRSVTDSVLCLVAQATTDGKKKGILQPARGTPHVSEGPAPRSDTDMVRTWERDVPPPYQSGVSGRNPHKGGVETSETETVGSCLDTARHT